jgi:hypothetical protein
MTEDFLHHVWSYKLFNLKRLETTSGEQIKILSVGKQNTESGPDFFDARIQIGSVLWIGLVEIHKNASDWWKHNHQHDKAYSKVILHIVWNYDKDVFDCNQNKIPVLELKGRISNALNSSFHQSGDNKKDLICEGLTHHLNDFQTQNWLSRLLIDRLEKKVEVVHQIYVLNKGDWSQTFYVILLKNLGFKVNSVPMQLLGQNIPFKVLLKNIDKLDFLEAILLGGAGFLEGNSDEEYLRGMKSTFKHLQTKYSFSILDKSIWKLGRVRPNNFPHLRLIQLAKIIHDNGDLFQRIIRDFRPDMNLSELNVSASSFWDTHYVFEEKSIKRKKRLGKYALNNLLINSVVPMLFFYGKEMDASEYKEMAIDLLERLPGENNSIIKTWKQNNIFAERASVSQALLEMTHSFCEPKRCLECGIGQQILKMES